MSVLRFAVCCAALFLLAACGGGSAPAGKLVRQHGGPKTRPDNVPERYIVLANSRGGEKLSLTYFHEGNYDPAAMKAINRLFRDRHNDAVGNIDPELIDFLVDIRTRLALPPTVVFEILSGYRCPETNAELARRNNHVAKESLHIHGWAVDFRVSGVNGSAIAEVAKTMQRGGVSFYPIDNHVHVDLGNIRTWPTK
ncbi:MAG: DUF882 domain-containing protein [Alphaproteobacteria bacterium]|nr:DUF882 domain-containing protein [Alphaproteobacteria bacterium]